MEKEEEGGATRRIEGNGRYRSGESRKIGGGGAGGPSSRASYTAIFFLEKRDPPSHAPSAARPTSTSRD
jgi:predicted cupin superfamily sugar epimerase